ncbi:MAG TPA: hypothetical protein VM221_10500 [Armatimonadota bacterium]|nr:hypothetical protein [Armatimonadota bacterium]
MNAFAPYVDTNRHVEVIPVVFVGSEADRRQNERIAPVSGTAESYPAVVSATGAAASDETWMEPAVASTPGAASNDALGERSPIVMRTDPARQRWLRLKRAFWTPEGRQARVERALKALEEAVVRYDLDDETLRWIAEDRDLEDM